MIKTSHPIRIISIALGLTSLVAIRFLVNIAALNEVPLPFGQGSSLAGQLTEIGKKNAIPFVRVTFPEGTNTETLVQDTIFLVTVPDDVRVSTGALDLAFSKADGGPVNYFGYTYVTANASVEKEHKADPDFLSRFPGTFFASQKARDEDAAHGGALSAFEARGVALLPTGGTGTDVVTLEKNSLYMIVVNETVPVTIRIRPEPVEEVPMSVCGDNVCQEDETDALVPGHIGAPYYCPQDCGPEPLPLSIVVQDLGVIDAVANTENLPVMRFTATAAGTDVDLRSLRFNFIEHTGLQLATYALWTDTNDDGFVDTLLQNLTYQNFRFVATFAGQSARVPLGHPTLFEVRAHVAASIPYNAVIRTDFGAYTGPAIEAVAGDQPLTGIETNEQCLETSCAIRVTSPADRSFTVHPAGTLLITQDTSVPTLSHQILGGTLGEVALRLNLQAELEDASLDVVQLSVPYMSRFGVDHFELFEAGSTTPFATAEAGCGGYNDTSIFCAFLTHGTFVIPAGTVKHVEVRPFARSDADGGVSGTTFPVTLYVDVPGPIATGYTAGFYTGCNAMVCASSMSPSANRMTTYIASATSPVSIKGPQQMVVLSKISSITNASTDPDGSPMIVNAPMQIGAFAITAADNQNTQNGVNNVRIKDLFFTVDQLRSSSLSDSYTLSMQGSQAAPIPCLTYYGTNPPFTQQVGLTGTVNAHCEFTDASASIAPGETKVFLLRATMQNQLPGDLEKSVRVSLQHFTEHDASLQSTYGLTQGHLRWIDTDTATSKEIGWSDLDPAPVYSTLYVLQ